MGQDGPRPKKKPMEFGETSRSRVLEAREDFIRESDADSKDVGLMVVDQLTAIAATIKTPAERRHFLRFVRRTIDAIEYHSSKAPGRDLKSSK